MCVVIVTAVTAVGYRTCKTLSQSSLDQCLVKFGRNQHGTGILCWHRRQNILVVPEEPTSALLYLWTSAEQRLDVLIKIPEENPIQFI